MIPAERQHFILSRLAECDILSIQQLTELLDVSHMTIRRDIQMLEQTGRVASVAGGVRLSRKLDQELPHLQKAAMNAAQKQAIGAAAAAMVRDGMVVYLDAGTTALEVARRIGDRSGLTVVTNDFVVCAYLSTHSDCTLYHSGGMVERANQSCVGPAAAQALAGFNYDIAFISTSSWTSSGLSSPSELKGPVKVAVTAQAKRVVLTSDSFKYGVVAALNILLISAFDTIVTDTGLDAGVVAELRDRNITVVIAGDDPSTQNEGDAP
ncbi:DeoR/GlpR family DNA-binding transcription regulator [Loktanella sp. M215]|uniref:DeoR/GlpR family DNA-binding transcription regulator n=1 Tax=Loktanella sp. M215 TaxID=2675431 RepID=UPI001F33F30B|nr:DeoR/GlpR family DNA-binding transcription regulator [Loktanella sp. M215]MCF7702445.1 DeoR family transcriptional regulator [Loktanella sp. M215]